MTATFGKLEHETLVLEPGLNILQAPNEWGKSTWCAFLLAMLYGLDTRIKSTKTALADKERYAPWSGSPMAGRMDIHWNGRDITIERRTRGRIPMGAFRAYETKTGIPVPELTAANCGQQLLGVEQSVFRRSGFIRFSDLPVTADEDLRRRLNALVTTGDESGDADRLARELRELRNRCRYNRTGLIPQAEAEAAALENKLAELESLEDHCRNLKSRIGEGKTWLRQLQNHRDNLAWAEAEADANRVAEARDAWQKAVARLETLEASLSKLPSRETAEQKIHLIGEFRENWNHARLEEQLSPPEPEAPELPAPFEQDNILRAREMVEEDMRRHRELNENKPHVLLLLLAAVCLLMAMPQLTIYRSYLAGTILAVIGLVLLIPGLLKKKQWAAELAALETRYGTPEEDRWQEHLQTAEILWKEYQWKKVEYHTSRSALDARLAALEKQRDSLCGSQSPEEAAAVWKQILEQWEQCDAARREARHWEQHLGALSAMAKSASKPEFQDRLSCSAAETERLILEARQDQQRLQNRLGQYQGRMEALGDRENLRKELGTINARLKKLQDTYEALTIALETLNDAKLELQRRFAPRITKRAQERMAAMTHGRYQRLTLGEDFSLLAGAQQEDVLQSILWRSDGTIDQLYLALRLAVAEELIPEAPLILDDALVRFDDERLKAALAILKQEGETKQVLLFTCQQRERNAL